MTPDAIEALRRAAETPAKAGPADIAAVAEDLAAAFAQDPQFNWFMRDDAKRAAGQVGFFKMLLSGIALSHGAVTRPITGGAAAIWLASETLGPNSMLAELRALPAILAATGFRRLGRLLAMREAMDKNHPMDLPHAYLWFIGVHPRAQGFGVGSRLLAAGLRDVDTEHRHAFLESSNITNVPLYQRHGFEVIQEYPTGPGAPLIYAMWRKAR